MNDKAAFLKQHRHYLPLLSWREQTILSLHYGLDGKAHSLDEIAYQFGVSVPTIRRVENHAFQKLKQFDQHSSTAP